MPLSLGPQPVRIRPVKNSPHLLVGVLNSCASEPESSKTGKLVVGFSNFCSFIFDTMYFVDDHAGPWEFIKYVDVAPREVERGNDFVDLVNCERDMKNCQDAPTSRRPSLKS